MLLSLALLFSGLVGGKIAFCAPAPSVLVVNHSAKQCAMYWSGDEFVYYELPSGWKREGGWKQEGVTCPEGYKMIQEIPGIKGQETERAKEWDRQYGRKARPDNPINPIKNRGWSCSAN